MFTLDIENEKDKVGGGCGGLLVYFSLFVFLVSGSILPFCSRDCCFILSRISRFAKFLLSRLFNRYFALREIREIDI